MISYNLTKGTFPNFTKCTSDLFYVIYEHIYLNLGHSFRNFQRLPLNDSLSKRNMIIIQSMLSLTLLVRPYLNHY
jgi:hypothetical protein